MGLFDFFKKLIEVKVDEPEVKKEEIAFSEIGNWIEKKEGEVELREKEVFDLVKKKIQDFDREIREKLDIVAGVDVELKKADDKIKFIVNEGRKKYIEFVGDFINKLENLEKMEIQKFIKNVNRIFSDFNKSSYMSYERTTILIGEEMANVKELLKTFSRDFMKIFEDNKDIVNLSKTISFVNSKLNQIAGIIISVKASKDKTRLNKKLEKLLN